MLGCPGFTLSNEDAGDDDAGTADVGAADVGSDAGPMDARDMAEADAGPCTLGELCDDENACTEGELCGESGCGGGSAITCEGTHTRCEGSAIIEETFTGTCDMTTGCDGDAVVTICPFLCRENTCSSCSWTDWTQTSLPLDVRSSARPTGQFAVDEEGGQHIVFPTEHLGDDGFLQVAVDYAFRANERADWEVESVVMGVELPDLSLAVHGEEPHVLVSVPGSFGGSISYWRRDGAAWAEETVPGVAHSNSISLVVTPDGQVHVVRSSSSPRRGLVHAQRGAGGVWTEEMIPSTRPYELSAVVDEGGDIHVVFREDEEDLGFARYDGSAWTVRTETVGARIINPKLAVAPDGTLVTSYVLAIGADIGVGTISSAGVWSTLVLTESMDRVTDAHAVAVDSAGGTHVVFQGAMGTRVTRSAYRLPAGDIFTFQNIVSGVEVGLSLHVDDLGKLRMLGRHILEVGEELRLSTRQTCL